MRSRSHPWWERCDVVGHAVEVPCQFCVRAQRRLEHLAGRIMLGGFEPGPKIYFDPNLFDYRGWTYNRANLDPSILF